MGSRTRLEERRGDSNIGARRQDVQRHRENQIHHQHEDAEESKRLVLVGKCASPQFVDHYNGPQKLDQGISKLWDEEALN